MVWRILKAEIEREKYVWLLVCSPLSLSIPILLYFRQGSPPENAPALRFLTNMAKGFGIVTGGVILRSIIGYLGYEKISRFHLRLPVSLIHQGIVRASNALLLLICTFILLFINFCAIPAQSAAPLISVLFLYSGAVLCIFSAMIVFMDVLNVWFRINSFHPFVFLLAVFVPIFLLSKRGFLAPFLTPLNIAILNILGLILIGLSIYTFTRLSSYLHKTRDC